MDRPRRHIEPSAISASDGRGQPANSDQAFLWKTFDYNAATGLLTWRIRKKGQYAQPGNEAGTIDKDGYVRVYIDGKSYAASRLIWFWATGDWPKGRLYFADGDKQNLKWENIVDKQSGGRQTRTARYQRELRQLNAEAKKMIEATPMLFKMAQTDPALAMREARDYIRSERMHLAYQTHGAAAGDLKEIPGLTVRPRGARGRGKRRTAD